MRRSLRCWAGLLGLAVGLWAGAAEAVPLSRDAGDALREVRARDDNRGAPFIIIDKRAARLWLFDANGRIVDSAPVLLGLAVGDRSVPGIGERELRHIGPAERTTPAGRFIAEYGRNLRGEDVIWVDYDSGVSMHRVLTTNPAERRLQRLATPQSSDNRISYGCINVPAAFFDRNLAPLIKRQRPVIYVLPETKPVATLFARKR